MKRILKVMTITLVLCQATLSPSYAARIYNHTDTAVSVVGLGVSKKRAYIPAGQRSKSLEWDGVNQVSVFKGRNFNKQLCTLPFGFHYQIVGGNYMEIKKSGNCFVCDSNHHVIVGHGRC